MQPSEIAIVCRALAICGLTATKVVVMQASLHGVTMTRAAQLVGHSTAAATGVVDTLEKLGYVKRQHGAADRRIVEVLLMPAGSEVLARVGDVIQNLKKNQEADQIPA